LAIELDNCLKPAQAHDYAIDLQEVLRHGDILIVAVGRAELVKASWVKPGAVVIDVGINVVEVTAANGACFLESVHWGPNGIERFHMRQLSR
jgi:5,10-methylene-tetrahydrofolate dehydrogenase/methenyl tetrahydrofolate cyclohydrolase